MSAWLMYLAFSMPWVAFWWCCCASYCNGACRNQTATNKTITVTISGVANALCALCTDLNGTWVSTLPAYSCNSFDSHFLSISPFCGPPYVWSLGTRITKVSGRTILYVYISGYPNATFSKDLGASPITCPPVGLQTLVYSAGSSAGGYCDFSSATITVEYT